MGDNLTIILSIVLIYLLLNDRCREFFTSEYVKSSDGTEYSVVSKYDDNKKAADTIAELNKFVIELIKRLKQKYGAVKIQNNETKKGYEVLTILEKRFNPKNVLENDPVDLTKTSYTKNKGEVIALCLREKQSGDNKFHLEDDIKFVLLHEIAHIITPEYNHSQGFWDNFRFLLEFAHNEGLYKSPDYSKKNVNYCGTTIKYNPMYDTTRTKSFFKEDYFKEKIKMYSIF